MEDLKLLYQSYVDKKLISDKTTFEQFSSASPKQLDLLYRSGVDGKLVSQKTDFNTFSSAWGEKKKESSEVSPSRPSEKPFASATSPKPPIQPTFRTEAPDVFGGVKPADRKAPEAPRDQLSPAAKAQVQARVARGEVAESEIAKREEPTTSAVVKSIAREDGLDRGSLYTDAAQSLIDVAINSGDLSSDQLDDKSNIESIFSSVALNRAQKNPKLSPEVERIQALMQSQNNAPYLQAQLQFAKSKDLDLKQKLESESLFAGLQQSVKGKILDSVPEGKKQDEEYLRKLETDLWLNEGIGMDLSGDKRFNDQNFAADAGLAFVRGARGLIKGIRSVVGIDVDEFGIPYEISDAIFSDTMRRNTTQFEQDFYDSLKDSEFSNAARIALNTTGESAPIMIAAGATALENPLASYALLSTLSAAQTYGDVKSEEWFKDLHPMAQIGYVGVSGAAEGLGELAGARTATRALRGLAVSATKEASEIALAQYFKGLIYRGTLNVSENYIGEGLTGATQYVNDAVARGTEVTLDGAVDAFKRNAAAGVGMALVISGPSFAVEAPIVLANKIGRNFEIKRIDSAIKKRRDELLQAPTVSDRKVIADDILKLTKQRDGEVKASIEYFDSMSPDDRATTYALSIQLDDMVQQRLNSEDEAARGILASNIMGVYNQIKEISQGYDTQKEAGVPGPVAEGEAPVEAQPIEGTVQEAPEAGGVLQVPVEEGAEVTAPAEAVAPIEATVFAAPFYDTKVSNVEEARAIRQTEPYVTNLETIRSASALFNVEIDGVDEAIGGFVNDAGDKIVEVSNIIRVKGTPEDVQNYAAFLATSSPETQEATIAATYVEQNSEAHNIDELTVSVSDIDGAIEALKENDIYDFTINDSNNTITFLDFSKGADVEFKKKIGRFAKSLDAKNITNEEQDIRAIDSKYIGPSERTGILGQIQETLVQQGQTGTELYRQVEQAIARNQEFLDKTATPAAEAVATQEVAEQPPAKNKTGLSSEQVTDAVSAAERLAKRLGLSTKIVVHNSRKDFNDAMDEVSNSGSLESGIESGRFIPSTDEVHINLEDMTSRVPFHEVFHAAFASRFSKGSQAVREKAASEFKDGVLRVLRAGTAQDRQLAAEVEQFVADGGYTARESPEEFMAQTAGFIANSGAKISKSTMDKLMQWLNNFIGKVIPSLKVTTRGEFIDFMNSFSGAMFESSTDKSLKDISEEGFYVPSEPVTMPDLSEPSSKRAFLDDAPAFIKDNIANLKALAGRKIPFAVFYDNLRVGKSTLRNSVTGKESNRNLMGGFGYSQLDGVKFEDDGARTAVLAFTSEDVTARKLSEFLRKDGDLVPVAMQNVQTGHLGNIDVVLDMFDPVEGVISTAPALYAQQQTGKDSGPEFEAARDAAEQEILGAIKQSVTELAVKPEKNPKKKDEPTERVKISLKIEPMLNDIKTLDDWRDKILLGAWDSFGARGLFNSYMLQAKPSKVTKSTRETHKILHGKYGVPTIKEVQDGMTENSLSNAELGDVVKFITIDDRAVIYTTDAKYSDLPAEGVEKKSDKISYTLKYIGDKVTPHTSYPYIIAGKNDGFAPSYIDITEIFPDLKGKVKKSQSFYSAGRRSLAAPSGEVDATIAESSSMEALEPEKGKSLADIRKSYEKSITPKISPKTILEEAKKLMIDRQSRIKNAVLELGLRTAYDRIVNKAGASARANDKYRRAEKKIYSGLKESEIKTLDDIIFARRVIQIDSNFDKRMLDAEARLKSAQAELSAWRSSKIDKKSARAIKQEKAIREKISQAKKDVETSQRPKHPLGYQSENGVFELNQLKEKLGDEKYNDLIRRSDLYFDEFRSTLKDLFDAGLVTEQTYNELRTNNYQPRKFIEHVFDFNNSEFLIRDFGLSGEQIKAIGTGSTGDLVMSSRFLMGAYQLSASKRILSNRTNTAIAEAIGKKGANDWVRETGPDGVVDPGFVKVYYFVDGVQQEFQLRADLKAELDNSSALSNIDPRLSVALSIVSGAPLLKLMATRANPLFAFKNFPRDLGHILLFTNIYDKHSLPYATYLVLGDFIKGLKSSIQDTQDFQEYMDLGGGMDFISIQGRDGNFVSRGAISKTIDVIGKLGEWSEVGFRIGVYKRFKDDGIAAFEKNNDSKPTGEDLLRIKESAVAKAREIIDFSQGGSAVKAIDKFAPYLNAAFQGFRVAVTYIANNPKKFAGKFVQAQMGLLGLAFYNLLIADDDEMEDIPEHTRLMNFIIFLPFTRVDEDGKKRRKYILVPKAIDGTPFFALMDIANRKIINEVFGKEYSISKDEYTYMINGARKGLPIGDDSAIKELTSLVPVFNAAFTYQSGYDTFRDRMVSMDMGKVLPAYEGVNDPNVEQFYKVLGEINGWSPIRTKTAVEKIITSPSSSFIVGMSYGILDAVARQYPLNSGDYNIKTSEDKMKNLAEQTGLNLSKAFVRETDPSWGLFNQKETLDNIDMAAGTERARLRAKAKELALGTNDPVKMEKSKKEALKLAQEIQKKNPIDAKYFLQSFKSNLGEAPSSQQSVEIQYSADDKARAKKIKLLYNPQNREDYMKIMRDVRKETGYKISAKTFYEYETAYGKLQ